MTGVIVFPPGCPHCGSSRLVVLQQMSRYHPTENWFRCDACGRFSVVTREPRPSRAIYLGRVWSVTAGIAATVAVLAWVRRRPKRPNPAAPPDDLDPLTRILEAAQARRRPLAPNAAN